MDPNLPSEKKKNAKRADEQVMIELMSNK